MFNKKKKEIEKLQEELFTKERECRWCKSKIDELEEKQYCNDKIIKALEQELYDKNLKYYKKYDYAILIKKHKVEVWNEDRFEKNVKEVLFNAHEGEIPEINIIK